MNTTKASQFRKAARDYLRKIAGADSAMSSWGQGGASDHAAVASAGGVPLRNHGGRGFRVKYGMEPTDADVDAFIKSMGGNPYARRGQASAGSPAQNLRITGAGARRAPKPPSPRELFQQLATQYQSKLDEANAANEARYQEGKGMLSDLAGRNQSRVSNWGIAQGQLNQEAAAETLKSQKAYLAARGLSNSTVLPAFEARNARDLALVQQDLSERRDARASEYDTRDTGNLAGWIERRYDNAPNPAPFLQMAQQLAESDAYQQAASQQPTYRPRTNFQVQQPQGVSPYRAMAMQQSMQSQLGGLTNMSMYYPSPPVPNRYPQRRTPEQYAAVRQYQEQQKRQPMQILSPPTYQQPLRLDRRERAYV